MHSSPFATGLPTARHVLPWSVEPNRAFPWPTRTRVWRSVPSDAAMPDPDEMNMYAPFFSAQFSPNGHSGNATSFDMSRGFDQVPPLSEDSCTKNWNMPFRFLHSHTL